MYIAVVDDERPARRELISQILEAMPDSVIEEADSGAAALELAGRCPGLELLFLDINLNDIPGTTLAAAVKKILPKAKVVFATAYSQYAEKAFELEVDDYLLKPFDPMRVRRVLERCRQSLEKKEETAAAPKRLPLSCGQNTVFLDIAKIVYAETNGRGSRIHTTEKSYDAGLLLGELEKRLAPCGFYRIHKSYLINPSFVVEMFPWAASSLAVKMEGFEKEILPVGREKLKGLKQRLGV